MDTGMAREARTDKGVVEEARMRTGVAGEVRWEVGRHRRPVRAGVVWSRADLLFADGDAVVPVPVAVPQPSTQGNQRRQ
jgi:hypothetical protein